MSQSAVYMESNTAVTVTVCGGSYGGGSENLVVSYQKVTGSLMANSHPGSYCGQDAYNDMLVTENEILHRERTDRPVEAVGQSTDAELYARPADNYRGGVVETVEDTIVRRLTPKECERLQGFPDDWTLIGEQGEDGEYYYTDSKGKRKKVTDGARYKALGNSICTPFWFYLLRRISAQYERPATMGSLFDGIGGFPLCWEKCNGKGTAVWASEIEEFPIAVTKQHFPEER